MLKRVAHEALSGAAKGAGSMFVLVIFGTIYQLLPFDEPIGEVELDLEYFLGSIILCVFMGIVGAMIYGTIAFVSELSDALERKRGNSK